MSLILDIGQGAGLAGAAGVRPYLPPLLAGALARGDIGIDFEGTSYDFLEKPWFLIAVLAVAVVAYWVDRTRGTRPDESRDAIALALGGVGLVLGGLLFAGSLADGDHTAWPGLLGGAAAAALGYAAVASIFGRARRRLAAGEPGSAGTSPGNLLDAYADAVSLALAGFSILVPPLGLVAVVAFVVLLVRSRGSGGRKYEGLRVLR
jgi:hypothetical protein